MIPIRQRRSIIHLGWGQSNIFQWDNWQLQEGIKTPTWYVITIVKRPMRTNKRAINFALQNLQSNLMTIPDAMLDESLSPRDTFMAYHKGNKYCERLNSAKIDIHNALNTHQKEYINCYPNYNHTNTCAKNKNHNANMQWVRYKPH